jgi:hypothetical protein
LLASASVGARTPIARPATVVASRNLILLFMFLMAGSPRRLSVILR